MRIINFIINTEKITSVNDTGIFVGETITDIDDVLPHNNVAFITFADGVTVSAGVESQGGYNQHQLEYSVKPEKLLDGFKVSGSISSLPDGTASGGEKGGVVAHVLSFNEGFHEG